MSFKVLIVDDEVDDETNEISRLPGMLQAAGYDVRTTSDGNQAYDLVWEYNPDLIVLDILFKGQSMDGIDICEAIRLNGCNVPIILVTGERKETKDVIDGLKRGANDYVTRPRDNREIMARIRVNLPPEVMVVDNHILVDFNGRTVWICREGRWQEIHLPRLEFELLTVLIINEGRFVPTTSLKDRVFGKPVSDAALAVIIHRVRQKVEPEPDNPFYLENRKAIGYRFNGSPTRASLTSLKYGCGSAEEDSFNE